MGTPAAGPTVLFDGDCGLCRRLVAAVSRLDRTGALVFAPLESEAGRLALGSAGLEPVPVEGVVLVESGRSFTKSEAVWRALHRLGPPWSVAARTLQLVPRRARDAAYDAVACRRHRLRGRPDACGRPFGRADACGRRRGAGP